MEMLGYDLTEKKLADIKNLSIFIKNKYFQNS